MGFFNKKLMILLTFSIAAITPIVAGDVSPLKDALAAAQTIRQLVVGLEDPVTRARVVSSRAIFRPQHVLIEAILVDLRALEGHRTRSKLEIALVVGGQLDLDGYHVTRSVFAHDYAVAVLSATFVGSGLKNINSMNFELLIHFF